MNVPRAVLFDLDDTLYDHLHGARSALISMQRRHSELQAAPIRELEDRYSHALESIHVRLLRGELTQAEARAIRMRQFFAGFGVDIRTDEDALEEYRRFRNAYDAACQVVHGSHDLLKRLRGTVKLGVITNNLVSEQIPKLEQLDLKKYFDAITISEEVGVAKPNPRIFEVALTRLGETPENAVIVGDSLSSDIEGGLAMGIRCVWIRRRPECELRAPDGVEVIDRDFGDLEDSLSAIMGRTII